jgi:hypothetical protein
MPHKGVPRRGRARSPSFVLLIARLECIEALSHDLAHDLARRDGQASEATQAMIEAIKREVDAVQFALSDAFLH